MKNFLIAGLGAKSVKLRGDDPHNQIVLPALVPLFQCIEGLLPVAQAHVQGCRAGAVTLVSRDFVQLVLPHPARPPRGKCGAEARDVPVCLFGGFSSDNSAANARVDGLLILASLVPTAGEASIYGTECGVQFIRCQDDSQGLVILARTEIHMPRERVDRYRNWIQEGSLLDLPDGLLEPSAVSQGYGE